MTLKQFNYVEADYDIIVIDLLSPEFYIGQSTTIIKKSGIWPVVVRYDGFEVARLESCGDSIKLLALATGWLILA